MKKNKLYLCASILGLLGLMTAGCSNNQTATKSKNSVKTSQSSTKNSAKSAKSESSVTSSSSTDETAHSKDSQNNNQTDLSSISDKVVGVLAYAVARPTTNMSDLGNGGFYYGTDYNYPDAASEIHGDHYINAGGNDEFDVWFKRNGDNISVSILDTANAPSSAEAKIKTTNYSLKQLVTQYYNTPEQKAQIDGYANALKDRN